MPWVPTTDFEEEVVNLQPHHDFIYGVLSEPQHTYPRPKAHTDYAITRKQNTKNAIRINGKLQAIQQVQRIANTKPIGEQPTVDDWENNKKIEQETIGMMRYCGMGVSVEQPLNEKVTIATYPVQNTIKVVQNGRRKMALYFDDNVFKLKEKVSDTSSDFESCNNGNSRSRENYQQNDTFSSKGGEEDGESNTDASSSSCSTFNSFTTANENNDTFSSISSFDASTTKLKAQRLQQYEKLLEETSALSLNSSSSNISISSPSCNSYKQNLDLFQTAKEKGSSNWKPIFYEPENIFEKQENWPDLHNNKTPSYHRKNTGFNKSSSSSVSTNDVLNSTTASSCSSNTNCLNDSNQSKRINFLDRFIKTENCDKQNLHLNTSSSDTSSDLEPKTYANIIKTPKPRTTQQEFKIDSNNLIKDFQPFYTTRKMYALKRNVK